MPKRIRINSRRSEEWDSGFKMLMLVAGLILVSVAVVGANRIRPIVRFRFQEVRYLNLESCISNLLFTPIIFFTFVKNFNNC